MFRSIICNSCYTYFVVAIGLVVQTVSLVLHRPVDLVVDGVHEFGRPGPCLTEMLMRILSASRICNGIDFIGFKVCGMGTCGAWIGKMEMSSTG